MTRRAKGLGVGVAFKPVPVPPIEVLPPIDWKTDTCECGAPKAPKSQRCDACFHRWGRERMERILALWNTGAPVAVIARELRMTDSQVNDKIDTLRRQGVPVPYRKPR